MSTEYKSLAEVNQSVDTNNPKVSKWKNILRFFGPAYLVSVGYMDPGNWATDIAGGSKYGYSLLWVLVMSNIMAFLLQSMSARLGVVYQKDLAQASRDTFPKIINFFLYILAEIAIAACDLAEVIGMAIGLKLLFNIPILIGVAITVVDTFILLYLQKLGMRRMETFIVSMISIIGLCFLVQIIATVPDGAELIKGLQPQIPDDDALYILIGIIGATVMPHNLYLHSSLVQTRKIDRSDKGIRRAIKLNNIDSAIALNLAFFVNASILVLAGSVFYYAGRSDVETIEQAHELLKPFLGDWAPKLFAIALIASGQSSTITGTLAGQIVMEGYLKLRVPIWIRRLMTRLLAIIPAVLVIYLLGEEKTGEMLILSQVILSFQLGFAIIPLLHFVSDKSKMGKFAIKMPLQILSWIVAFVIIGFNIILIENQLQLLKDWTTVNPNYAWVLYLAYLIVIGLTFLLGYILVRPKFKMRYRSNTMHADAIERLVLKAKPLKRIGVTVDFSKYDEAALNYAIQLSNLDSIIILLHIVETPGAVLVNMETGDSETVTDKILMTKYANLIRSKGYNCEYQLGYGRRVQSISNLVVENKIDILIMASHGHNVLMDLIRGETIDPVRHNISIPLLAVPMSND
ncbi:MAG: Nramp family divalent metal transporter [Bacteroidota bacterium]|nr:Nramp family divalent metal transporter [Bacteroidota bacterium]